MWERKAAKPESNNVRLAVRLYLHTHERPSGAEILAQGTGCVNGATQDLNGFNKAACAKPRAPGP